MTRQDQIYKWFIYSLGLLPVWLLDCFVLGRYPLWGSKPLLLLLAVVSVSVLEGAYAGAGFGLGVGLVWVLGYADVNSGMILLLVCVGAVVGSAAQYALTQGFLGCLVCSAGALAVLEGLHIFSGLFTRSASLPVLLGVAGKEFLWTLAWTPAVYLVFRQIFQKVGLDKLA